MYVVLSKILMFFYSSVDRKKYSFSLTLYAHTIYPTFDLI